MELTEVANKITSSACPEDVFGGPNDGSSIMAVYRTLISAVHPDHFQNDPNKLTIANEAFTSLTSLRKAAERKVKAGTYGQKDVAAPPEKETFKPYAIEVRGTKFILTDLLATGDIADIYRCTIVKGAIETEVVFKIVRDGADNDLLENERRILNQLYPPNTKEKGFYRFLPRVLDSFVVRSPGSQRRVNLLPFLSEHRSLDEVIQVYPDGIHYKDMVWMFKRILHGIGFAHTNNNIVHGALIPPHIMIHPVDHGAKLMDWSYAVDISEEDKPAPKKTFSFYDHLSDDSFLTHPHVKAISGDYREFYPPEIFDKKTPSAATDIYMAAKCAVALVGGDVSTNTMPDEVPKEVQDFFLKCLRTTPSDRPQDAWDAHEELDTILKRVVGKRKYRKFPMPRKG